VKKVTKKSRLEAARCIIDRNSTFVPFSSEDLAKFSLACCVTIEGAERRPNPKFPQDPRHLYMKMNGEDWKVISWKKLIVGWDQDTSVKKVMREAISIDLWNFKKALKLVCERCGSVDHPSVDHVDPPFNWIAEQFIEANGLPIIADSTDGVGNVFGDSAVKVLWIKFHTTHAKYQILCRSCNSSKGKR
jgi:hypothetical protein